MVGVNQVSLFFADRAIFNEINFIVNKQDRIGLVGKNGAGKSTMLKALAGIQKLDAGSISYPNGLSIGYLPQDMDFISGRTVWEETESTFEDTLKIQEKIEDINHQLAVREDYESDEYLGLLDALSDLNEELGLMGADTMEAEIEKILLGLGFQAKDFQRQTTEFSGGWRMRIELAKILLKNANLLLLDEPTNHLDIESIQWLEQFLKTYAGAVVLISHDRAFLDNLCNRTIEISMGRIYDYPAPYTKYLDLRKERREQELAAYNNQQKQIKQTEEFIDRFRAKATKAVQVQSRIKALNRMDKIEIDVEDNSTMRFSFPPAPHSGKLALRAEHIAKKYDEKTIFSNVDLAIERGEKVAFVGKNGEGKSTFSRLIMGEKSSAGAIELGFQVKVGYYAQNQAEILDPDKTVFETIDDAARGEIRTKVRNLLGSFLFGGDDVDKKVKVLSGGERARLALCKLLLEPVNLLILDEPTNHLDIRSKDILKDALKRYDGTLILISHDRDFLTGLCGKTYEFSNGRVKEHLGGIKEFLAQKQVQDFKEYEKKPVAAKNEKNTKSKPANSYQLKKDLKKDLRAAQQKVNSLEKKIAQLEEDLAQVNKELTDSQSAAHSQEENISKWQKIDKELKMLMQSWEEHQEILEEKQIQLDELGD